MFIWNCYSIIPTKNKNIRSKFNSKPQNYKHEHYRFCSNVCLEKEGNKINNASGNNKIRVLLVYGKLSCEIYQKKNQQKIRNNKIET